MMEEITCLDDVFHRFPFIQIDPIPNKVFNVLATHDAVQVDVPQEALIMRITKDESGAIISYSGSKNMLPSAPGLDKDGASFVSDSPKWQDCRGLRSLLICGNNQYCSIEFFG